MMRQNRIFPTRNLETIADDCGGVRHVQETEDAEIGVVVKKCFAFGGINAVLVCRRLDS